MASGAIHDTYQTGPVNVGWFSRAFPSVAFYWRLARLVWWASGLARKGVYTDEIWADSSRMVMSALESSGVEVEVVNVAAFRELDGPCVFVGNHMSTFEGFVFPSIIRPHRPVTFIIKEDLMRIPVAKHIFATRKLITVTRKHPRDDLKRILQDGEACLNAGISVVVFPQTTRTPEFDESAFNSAGVKLARRAGVPIIPVAVRSDAWGNGRIIKDIGPINPDFRIRVCFGQPLTIQGNGKHEHQACVDFIKGKLKVWKQAEGASVS